MQLTTEEKNLLRTALSKYNDLVGDEINDCISALGTSVAENEEDSIVVKRQTQLVDLKFWQKRRQEVNELYDKVWQL